MVAFVPQGTQLVSCSRDGSIRVWDVDSGFCAKTLSGHVEWVRALSISGDGAYVASGGDDRSVRLWKLANGECVSVMMEHSHFVESVAIAPEASAKLLDETFKNGHGNANSAAGGTSIYVASGSRDKNIVLWDALSGSVVSTLQGHENWVRAVVWHPHNPRLLLSCSDDKCIRVWDVTTGRCIKRITAAHDHFVSDICMTLKRPMLVSGGVDQKVKVWDCR
jgi:platelet-activating factor acetylhydrolase IB subunit alpha